MSHGMTAKHLPKTLKTVYKAANREQAETQLLKLSETWGKQYAMAVRSWGKQLGRIGYHV